MVTKRYCVLWIPTCLHKGILPIDSVDISEVSREYISEENGENILEENIQIKNILASDEAEKKVYLDLTLLKSEFVEVGDLCHISKRNILVNAKLADGQIFDSLLLRCLDARRNGLFLYEYIAAGKYLDGEGAENKYLLNSDLNVTNILYHSIKSFYHIHECHSVRKDSILPPFSYPQDVNPQDINLSAPDNPALLHYLGEFEKIFLDENTFLKSLKKTIDEEYNRIIQEKAKINPVESPEEYSNILADYLNCTESYVVCANQCNRALKMHIYYQTLLHSKHNKLFALQKQDETYVKDFYKKAINVHNTIESIKLLHEETLNKANSESLNFLQHYAIGIAGQTNEIKQQGKIIAAQTEEIKTQGKEIVIQTQKIEDLTKETSALSSKLTKRTTIIGILAGIAISIVFFLLSQDS